jgi:23S rRNA (cytidine1920-2'-O)/16S rRNA (cytidine1409-2'-O)-methyltransferase
VTRPGRRRLDVLLAERGLAGSRDRAQRMIQAGDVWVAGQRITKPGVQVAVDAALEVRAADIPFVSRGGLKLDAALTHWGVEVRGTHALDVGASTGGFTDCLLQHGAAHVTAIDVGYGQFAWKLRIDPRVTLLERTNIRHVEPSALPHRPDFAVIDVSFISLRLVLPVVTTLLRPGAAIIALVKPQFEVGKGAVGKGGVVRDPAQRTAAVEGVRTFAETLGLDCRGACESPVPGPKGNVETFLYFTLPH